MLTAYGRGPYARQLKRIETDLRELQKRVGEKMGVKESDTGLAAPNLWDTAADRQRMSGESACLQVARCTKIIKAKTGATAEGGAATAPRPQQGPGSKPNADEEDKYVINIKQIAKFVVGLGERVAPTDVEEGMRVGSVHPLLSALVVTRELIRYGEGRVDRNKHQIQIPLPPKIDASVTMMQVEEKPDVTYADVGGCKEQIEKLREVVETPLLNVRPPSPHPRSSHF